MNEHDYKELTQYCDEILLDSKGSVDRMAISWLHVLNEHPNTLSKYVNISNPIHARLQNTFKSILGICKSLILSLSKSQFLYEHIGPNRKETDFLFISHLVNPLQLNTDKDFYFGNVPEFFSGHGRSSAVALISQIEKPFVANDCPSRHFQLAPRIILRNTLDFLNEVTFVKRLLHETVCLIRQSCDEKNQHKKRILNAVVLNAMTVDSMLAQRLAVQISALVKAFKPKAIFVTFEGHAWERLTFAAARKINPEIKCIGYQHAILFPRQHAIYRSLGSNYDPDTIFTAGLVGYDKIKKNGDFEKVKVNILGTHRCIHYDTSMALEQRNCLIIPDGVIGECLYLFEFALQCAIQQPQIRFILRLHPVITFTELAAHNKKMHNLPTNFELSDMSFSDDLSRSRWALYRGSGSVVHAVCAGIRPIYVMRDGEMSIDPLHEVNNWRKCVTTSREVCNIITSDLQERHSSLKKEATVAVEYCKKYFVPLNFDVLNKLLSL